MSAIDKQITDIGVEPEDVSSGEVEVQRHSPDLDGAPADPDQPDGEKEKTGTPAPEKPEAKKPEGDGKPDTGVNPQNPNPEEFVPRAQIEFKLREQERKLQEKFSKELETMRTEIAQRGPVKPEDREQVQTEVADDIKTFAEKNGLDADAISGLAIVLQKQLSKQLGIPESKMQLLDKVGELLPVLEQVKTTAAEQQDAQHFEGEWTSYLPEIKKEFANATPEQVTKARELMDELAHSEAYGLTEQHPAFPLDYVFFKEKEKFKEILFSPKRKTAEPSHIGSAGDAEPSSLDLEPEEFTKDSVERLQAGIAAHYRGKRA